MLKLFEKVSGISVSMVRNMVMLCIVVKFCYMFSIWRIGSVVVLVVFYCVFLIV